MYDKLLDMLKTISKEGFLKKDYVDMLIETNSEEELISLINSYKTPAYSKV